jgi:hypothetical protein
MLGHLDFQMSEAAGLLRSSGHEEAATRIEREVIGRNVLDGRWTFQVIDEFDDVYYAPVRTVENALLNEFMAGRRHVYEAELKEQRRTVGERGHDRWPAALHATERTSAAAAYR